MTLTLPNPNLNPDPDRNLQVAVGRVAIEAVLHQQRGALRCTADHRGVQGGVAVVVGHAR